MSQSKQPKDADQIARFKEAAKAIGADTGPGALDRAFEKINPKKKKGGGETPPPHTPTEPERSG
jgi:hypothetical protein